VKVIGTDEFEAWYLSLDENHTRAVNRSVELLRAAGLQLGFPHSSAIKGANVALRELRAHSGSTMLRILYAFDRERDAVLLIGGDKSGDGRFYERMIPLAERIFAEYLQERAEAIRKRREQGLKDDEEDDEHD
jgi:hypothetical protein